MGSNTSKPNHEASGSFQKLNIGGDSDQSDPRSPNPEISRTPLQSKNGMKHNITKNADLRKTFEGSNNDKLIHNNPILSAVIKNHLQSYDPRSPTQDFERTPIVIAPNDKEAANDKNLLRLENGYACGSPNLASDSITDKDAYNGADNKHSDMVCPKNLCNGFFEITLDDTLQQTEMPLGSSTASDDSIENNLSNESIQKPTTLLETNFDYLESDQEKFHDSMETVEELDKSEGPVATLPHFKILKIDPRSPSNGIERTPIAVTKLDESSEDNVEEMSDDTLIKVLQSTNAELRQGLTDRNAEGLLIYEDQSESNSNVTPRKAKSAANSGSRTPLSCVKNKAEGASHVRSKSANIMLDPANQKEGASKIPKRVSHIPRLKMLAKQPMMIKINSSVSMKGITMPGIAGDCENTPPNSHRDIWDKDSSIVL